MRGLRLLGRSSTMGWQRRWAVVLFGYSRYIGLDVLK